MKKRRSSLTFGYLALALVVVVYISMSSEKQYKPVSTFNDVMSISDEYPEDPYTLMSVHNKISLCLYGGSILDEEIEPVLVKQRLLFSDEILELNPFETHLAKTQEQISYYRELKLYIHTINTEAVEYDKTDDNICYITVRQHTNTLTSSATVYFLAKRDDVWKIIGWEIIQEEADK